MIAGSEPVAAAILMTRWIHPEVSLFTAQPLVFHRKWDIQLGPVSMTGMTAVFLASARFQLHNHPVVYQAL